MAGQALSRRSPWDPLEFTIQTEPIKSRGPVGLTGGHQWQQCASRFIDFLQTSCVQLKRFCETSFWNWYFFKSEARSYDGLNCSGDLSRPSIAVSTSPWMKNSCSLPYRKICFDHWLMLAHVTISESVFNSPVMPTIANCINPLYLHFFRTWFTIHLQYIFL